MTTVKPPLPTTTLGNARHLRGDMTDAEQKLWQPLRSGQLEGLKFRRQHPIPPYIADFCGVADKLIVELDGSQHEWQTDAKRTRYLEAQGWKVLRFWDNDAATTEAVIEAIWNFAGKPDPHPNPSPDGGGLKRRASLGARGAIS